MGSVDADGGYSSDYDLTSGSDGRRGYSVQIMTSSIIEQGVHRALDRLSAHLEAQRELDRVELIAVGEMMLNPKKLAFARWLYINKKVTDCNG